MIFSFIFCSTEIYIIWALLFPSLGQHSPRSWWKFPSVSATNYQLERVPSSQVVQIRVGGPCGPAQSQLLPFTNQRLTGLNLKAPMQSKKPKRTWPRQNTEICQWGVATVSEMVADETKAKRNETNLGCSPEITRKVSVRYSRYNKCSIANLLSWIDVALREFIAVQLFWLPELSHMIVFLDSQFIGFCGTVEAAVAAANWVR